MTGDRAHIASSMSMIGDAARLAGSGSAALLGCGRCGEIPLRLLGDRFEAIDLVDLDGPAIDAVVEKGRALSHTTWRVHPADLTGLIPRLQPQMLTIAASAGDPRRCLDRFAELLGETTPELWSPPANQRYDLVVCSAVLTQLQATTRKGFQNAFASRFPEHVAELSSYEPWRSALWTWAPALEDAFVRHLGALCAEEGLIYLSDTVHVCWLTEVDGGRLATEGAWIATRTPRLRDYVDPDCEVVREKQWEWLRREQEGPYWGRLYGVQAITYRPRKEGLPS
jgi:hypothetical protein